MRANCKIILRQKVKNYSNILEKENITCYNKKGRMYGAKTRKKIKFKK